MSIKPAGTIVVHIKNKSQFRFHLKCPTCGKDLTEQFKNQLYISENKKYLPLNALSIYEECAKYYMDIKIITTDCCNLKMVYKIYPQKIETRNVTNETDDNRDIKTLNAAHKSLKHIIDNPNELIILEPEYEIVSPKEYEKRKHENNEIKDLKIKRMIPKVLKLLCKSEKIIKDIEKGKYES